MEDARGSPMSSASSNFYSPSGPEQQDHPFKRSPDPSGPLPPAATTSHPVSGLTGASTSDTDGTSPVDALGQRKRKWSSEFGDNIHYGHIDAEEHPGTDGPKDSEGAFHDPACAATDTGQKRAKVQDDNLTSHDRGEHPSPEVSSTLSRLPPEIWQHIFTFLSPPSLGRTLQVNRAFRDLLMPRNWSTLQQTITPGRLKLQVPDSIWATSRKAFFLGVPRPLADVSELEMWRLLRGRKCQFCGKPGTSSLPSVSFSPWESGPGSDGVRIIWPFAIRSCAECLGDRVQKEMDLLFSSAVPSMLLPALPFAFLTQSMHLVLSTTLRSNSPPAGLQLTKFFFKPHIDALKQKFEDVKALGPAAAEEWVKGLEQGGRDKLSDAARWEQWEANAGFQTLREPPESNHPGPQLAAQTVPKATTDYGSERSTSVPNGPISDLGSLGSGLGSPANFSSAHAPSLPPRPLTPQTRANFPQPMNSLHKPMPMPMPVHHSQPRMERSIRDVNEAKATRRAEIERRCLELNPPISASVLIHMESFAAAIQIPTPMSDAAWEVLKPRLLAQREIAERRAEERLLQSQLLQVKTEERRQQEAQLKEAKETLDREWDEVQKPIRDRMALYADEIIRDQWRGGDAITKEQCPKFAADVLLYVRQRFLEDQNREDAVALASGRPIAEDPPNAPPTRKLILDNMKWVFDTKVKPLTEQYQKELFLCNGCENNSKFYGFEGVVQHYAAKHTTVLSMGSIVVHWRAEWPEPPPFNPSPNAVKSGFYSAPTQAVGSAQSAPGVPSMPPSYLPGAEHNSHAPESSQVYPQPSPGPYGRSQYPGQFPYHQEPYRAGSPPSAGYYAGHQGNPYGYASSQPAFSPAAPPYQTMHPQQPPQQPMYSPYPSHAYPTPFSGPDSRSAASYAPPHYGPQPNAPTFPAPYSYPPRPPAAPPSGPPGQIYGIYQVQLEALATNAREIWNGTSGIKDLPSSIRIHVIIHHVVLRFKDKFTNEPNLALFTDGLNNNSQMKPIRTLNGMSCKACTNNTDSSLFQPLPQPLHREKKLYALPALLSHFQSVHIERAKPTVIPQTGIEMPRLDWKFDMVELPERSAISALLHAAGMDDTKLKIFATVFPEAFPSPLPKIGSIPNPDEVAQEPSGAHHLSYGSLGPSQASPYYSGDGKPSPEPGSHSGHQRGLEVSVDNFPKFVDSPFAEPAQSEPAREDEYDPHRPAYLEPARDQYGRVEQRRARPQFSPSNIQVESNKVRAVVEAGFDYSLPSGSSGKSDRDPVYGRQDATYASSRETGPTYEYRSSYVSGQSSSRNPSYRPQASSSDYSRPTASHRSLNTLTHQHTSSKPDLDVQTRGDEAGERPISIQEERTRASPPAEGISAAEHFLNNFDPSDDHDEYHPQIKHSEERRRLVTDETPDKRTWRDAGGAGTAESSLHGTPTHNGSQNGWVGKKASPPSVYREYESRPDVRSSGLPSTLRRGGEHSPDLINSHYSRKEVVYQDSRQGPDQPSRRPHSRFDRYEAQRQGSQRPRSVSPQLREKYASDTPYYRERSPMPHEVSRQVYPAQSPEALRDRRTVEEPVTYTRLPAGDQYQYVEEARFRGPYDEHVEYIPVRVAAREPYYVERQTRREVPQDYVRYEDSYGRDQVFEHNGHLYRAAPRAADAHDLQEPYERPIRYR